MVSKRKGKSTKRTETTRSPLEDTASSAVDVPMNLFQKVKSASTHNWTRDELLDAMYWFRQIVCTVLGVLFGTLGIQGMSGIVSAIGINTFLSQSFMNSALHVDEAKFDPAELIIEGTSSGAGLFFSCWIVLYTIFHAPLN